MPDDLLLVFSARITLLSFPRTSIADADFDLIDAIINLFLQDGDPGTLDMLCQTQHPGRSVHLLPAIKSLLQAAHVRNKSGRGRIRYFPDLADVDSVFPPRRPTDGGSPLYEALRDWWLGDFAIPGPLPSGLAELPIHRVSQLREAFGN